MIHGHKPAAHFVTATGDGFKIEGEQRQCIHCGFHWTPSPGSGTIRGYCLRCDGWLCGRWECHQQQRAMLNELARLSGSSDRHCIPFEDYVNRQRDLYAKDSRCTVTPDGIVIVHG